MDKQQEVIKSMKQKKDVTYMIRPAIYGWGIYEPYEIECKKSR